MLGYCTTLAKFGTMALGDVLAPAIQLARNGFMVRPYVHYYWSIDQKSGGQANTEDKLRYSETGRPIYFKGDGALKRPGDIVTNVDLARTLERLAKSGPDIFYHGEIAEEIAADMVAHGGLLSRQDLAAYRVIERAPVWAGIGARESRARRQRRAACR